MKGLRLLLALVLITAGAQTIFAAGTSVLKIQNAGGSLIAQIGDNGTCVNIAGTPCATLTADLNTIVPDTVSVVGTLGGWTLNIITGASHSPSLTPFGLDVASLTAACSVVGGCTGNDELNVYYSDVNFAGPIGVNGFTMTYTNTQNGIGQTSQTEYYGAGLFDPAHLIGTVGPLSASGGGTVVGGPVASANPFSLTMMQTFSATGPTSFSTDGSVTAVPEPTTLALFGTALAFCASRLRKRFSA